MLIEAAKGGHTTVVNLLLDWPNNTLSPTADLSQLSPPQSTVDVSEVSLMLDPFATWVVGLLKCTVYSRAIAMMRHLTK